MKHIVTIAALSLIQSIFAADEYTPLVKPHDSGFELIILDDAITIQKAYDQGLHAHKEGHLVFIHKNLNSCAGLSTLKDKLNLETITYVNFSNNKLQEVHQEIFTTMPNLVKCDLSGNHITKICDPIPSHQKLETLLLYNNKFTQFPLEQLLQNVPLKQLILDENKITNYGFLCTDHTSLEELWIDPTNQKWLKQIIASRCKNLVAEMCANDTTVQDANTETKYSEAFLKERKSKVVMYTGFGGIIGVISGLGGFFGCMTTSCLFVIPAPAGPLLFMLGAPAIGILTGATIGTGASYCYTKPEERITKTILKQIAQCPPIIETLRKQAQKIIEC